MTRKYTKRNKKYWYGEHYFTTIGILFVFIMITMWLLGRYVIFINSKPLVSPIVEEAKAESERISCENPKGYLECKVYKGEITWEDYDKLTKIINCESRWNDQAINVNKDGSIDRGIFQLNSKWHKKISNEESFNFKKNIDYGVKLYKAQGVKPWVCARILKIK